MCVVFGELGVQIVTEFWIGLCVSLMLNFDSSLYILEKSLLSDMCKYLLSVYGLFFILLTVSSKVQKLCEVQFISVV